jgi:N-acyl-phosphatidylethanolamine-hydrolysing phospholipase D
VIVISNKVLMIIMFLLLLLSSCSCSSTKGIWVMGTPKHHLNNGYRNFPITPGRKPGFTFYTRRVFDSIILPDVQENHVVPEQEVLKKIKLIKSSNMITWLGHSAFLIIFNGKKILTDPYLTEYASPYIRGPKRFVKSGISIENLPAIDVIIISHDHYDHLDEQTIEALPGKEKIMVIVPLGIGKLFKKYGYKNIQELDWWSKTKVDNITFTLLPALHDSGRSTSNKNNTLWGSWAITTEAVKLYFAGDTGYSKTIFKKIGKLFSGFDYAFVPIGAYAPRKALMISHTNPEEAVQIGKDLGANNLIGMHWGTIKLSDEPIWEPPVRFKKAGKLAKYSDENLWVMKIGDTRKFDIN